MKLTTFTKQRLFQILFGTAEYNNQFITNQDSFVKYLIRYKYNIVE